MSMSQHACGYPHSCPGVRDLIVVCGCNQGGEGRAGLARNPGGVVAARSRAPPPPWPLWGSHHGAEQGVVVCEGFAGLPAALSPPWTFVPYACVLLRSSITGNGLRLGPILGAPSSGGLQWGSLGASLGMGILSQGERGGRSPLTGGDRCRGVIQLAMWWGPARLPPSDLGSFGGF